MIDRLLDPLTRQGFWPAFTCGIVALGVGMVLVRRRGEPVAIGGWLMLGAVVAGGAVTGALDRRLLIGAALVVPARVVLRRPGRWSVPASCIIVATASAVATARVGPEQPLLWMFAVVATMGLAAAFVVFDRRSSHRGLAMALLAISAGGVYSTVPDTGQALVLLAAWIPLLLAAWPRPLVPLGISGALVVAISIGWVVASGGVGRPGSLAGGFGAAGILAADPLSRLFRRHGRVLFDLVPPDPLGSGVLLAVQVALALAAGRLAGLHENLWAALMISGGLLGGAALIATFPRGASAQRRGDE
jgi:hypothetical protein